MIKELTIKGWKSIRQQTVPLNYFNVLIGGNGVGKSNFIGIFSFLRALYEQDLQGYTIRKGGPERILHFGKKQTQFLQIILDFTWNDENKLHGNTFDIQLGWAQNRLYIRESSSVFHGDYNRHRQPLDNNQEESTIRDQRHGQAYWINQRFQEFAVYHFHDTSDTSPMKELHRVDDNRVLRKDGGNIASFLYHLKQHSFKHFKRIEKTIQSIAPFFLGFQLEPLSGNANQIKLEWKERGNYEGYFDAHDLSDGTLRFICLVTLLLQPNPPKTIIIDEPELGLHPLAIDKLTGLMQRLAESKKSQIIVSTQSTDLVNNTAPEDVIVVDREDQQTVFNHLEAPELSDWLERYSLGDIWQKNIIGGQPF